jgi:6-phosphogluconolactonase
VPFDHPDSNYAMVHEMLISRIPIPRSHIHPMPVGIRPPGKAAEAYERDLRTFFGQEREGEPSRARYTFDVNILGLGADGHTASLFPESPVLEEERRWVRSVQASKTSSPKKRLTLTYPAINKSRYICFLVSGENKKHVLTAILKGNKTNRPFYPAERIRSEHKLFWYIDIAAAGGKKK